MRRVGRCAAGAAACVLVVLATGRGMRRRGRPRRVRDLGGHRRHELGGRQRIAWRRRRGGRLDGGRRRELPPVRPRAHPPARRRARGPCAQLDDQPYELQFLHGVCEKAVPTDLDRDRPCPILHPSANIPLTGGGTAFYRTSDAPLAIDDDALVGVVPDELDVTVILIRRAFGRPHTRVLSTGSHFDEFQPWSSTKFLAAANAAARLRIASGFEVGLTARVDGRPLGDLVSSMHLHDWSPFSSNALGRYFHDVGGRQRANDMIMIRVIDGRL